MNPIVKNPFHSLYEDQLPISTPINPSYSLIPRGISGNPGQSSSSSLSHRAVINEEEKCSLVKSCLKLFKQTYTHFTADTDNEIEEEKKEDKAENPLSTSSFNTVILHEAVPSSHQMDTKKENEEAIIWTEAKRLFNNFLKRTTQRTYYVDGELYYRPRHSLSDIMKVGSVFALIGGYQSIEACIAKSYNGKAFSYLALIKRLDQAEEEYDLLLKKTNTLSREPLVLCKPMGVCDRLSWEIDFPISERRVKQKIIVARIMEKLRVKAIEWGCEPPIMPSKAELINYGFPIRDIACGDMFILPHKRIEDQ